MLINRYARSHENRVSHKDPSVVPQRKGFMKAALINFLLLQLLFLALFAYIFGSLYTQGNHTHNLRVVYVDYDEGVVGASVREAYRKLAAQSFPTLHELSPSQYAAEANLKSSVCNLDYWAAIFTTAGASDRLSAALAGGAAATAYDPTKVVSYIWNEALYSAVMDSAISGKLDTLAEAARVQYMATNGTGALSLLNTTDPAAVAVFAQPWTLTDIDIQATSQGSRLIYNTLVVILILIQEFFYLGTINGLYAQFKIYTKLFPHRIIAYRLLISLAYTFIGSLCVTGSIWAFRYKWDVDGSQYMLTWMTLWLFAHVNFLSLDIFTIWFPLQYVPMSLIAWVIINVTSILLPFDLVPGFYRWGYALPAHEVYQILTDIWSRGCNPRLYYALPILFAWEIFGLVLASVGVYRRCHFAVIGEEQAEAAFRSRVENALAFERKRNKEHQDLQPVDSAAPQSTGSSSQARQGEEELEMAELSEAIRKEDEELERQLSSASRRRFGPSFNLAYSGN